jgi:hypothetical protein
MREIDGRGEPNKSIISEYIQKCYNEAPLYN